MEHYLDLDYLRSLNCELHWFGLGFIQMKINHNQRIHFWSTKVGDNSDNRQEAHNHRYDFKSTVLKGALLDERWVITDRDDMGEWNLWDVSCDPNNSESARILKPVNVESVALSVIKEGEQYSMSHTEFHRSHLRSTHVVTFLERSEIVKETAQVVRSWNRGHSCPFAVTIPEDQLWDMIKDILHG